MSHCQSHDAWDANPKIGGTRHIETTSAAILSSGRERKISKARAIISYLGVRYAGYTQTELAEHLNISRIAVRNSIFRAEKMVDTCMEIWEKANHVP